MTTVAEIEQAVAHLPKKELLTFRSWFEEFDAEAWDRQFEQDVKEGKLDAMGDEALRDLEDGRCTKL
jgi:hypothetical protein